MSSIVFNHLSDRAALGLQQLRRFRHFHIFRSGARLQRNVYQCLLLDVQMYILGGCLLETCRFHDHVVSAYVQRREFESPVPFGLGRQRR